MFRYARLQRSWILGRLSALEEKKTATLKIIITLLILSATNWAMSVTISELRQATKMAGLLLSLRSAIRKRSVCILILRSANTGETTSWTAKIASTPALKQISAINSLFAGKLHLILINILNWNTVQSAKKLSVEIVR